MLAQRMIDASCEVSLQESARKRLNSSQERALVSRLDQHYGDGTLYLAHGSAPHYLELARTLGFVSPNGRITSSGYRFWRRRV